MVIVRNDRLEFGILADAVNGIREIRLEDIMPVPSIITGIGEEYLKGITKDRIIILSGEDILNDERIIIRQKAD